MATEIANAQPLLVPMKRIIEPELMDDDEQARAYAQADFSAAHQAYVALFARTFPDRARKAAVLDLGCGPGDVTLRFAKANPGYTFNAVDGSTAMLKYGRAALKRMPAVAKRIRFIEGYIPAMRLPRKRYGVILSSSLLHHLPDPQALWRMVRRYAKKGALVFVADLFRPESRARAQALVNRYTPGEPDVLRRDFFNSLLAAFTPEEVKGQLNKAGLKDLAVEVISDRHLMVCGRLKG